MDNIEQVRKELYDYIYKIGALELLEENKKKTSEQLLAEVKEDIKKWESRK
ncbi:hypothetical protein [Pseudobacteroides cellulosolvens]|uniref:Uncharacterized protein n=1 Tax=Pseudobacteroides cellulosolvens ATCC 35603 = DSM 2933 TaxID=398512 RepID=A0A0L6JGY6_9FIRM|nr:hypothetical protein [Pseudobacteroides cellulosolvens]KNY24988.1 hypothetical protein Bccel_0245 [Pseudobacteroides cellulosolvens ATCC 35603 = DSM 2933]